MHNGISKLRYVNLNEYIYILCIITPYVNVVQVDNKVIFIEDT